MKYILAQPATLRFQWELDVLLTNLRLLDVETPVVLLFTDEYMPVVAHFRGRYPNLEIHSYPDERPSRNYTPTIRPYLMWRYLTEDQARENDDYFQIDSDIIFRELPDFSKMPLGEKVCWAADCSVYVDHKYISSCQQGPYIVEKFSELLNVPVEIMRETPGGGAQWLYGKPTAALWHHIWQVSQRMYDFLDPLGSNIQKWTAEMWGQLYSFAKFGWEVRISEELAFCRPTDPVEFWDQVKILHNAGVVNTEPRMFFKGKYVDQTPFGEDLGWVDPTKASKKYAEAIELVYND